MNDNIPKTKEEILRKNIGLIPYISLAENTIPYLDAMQEFSDQQCNEYQKYLLKTNIAYESVYTSFLESLNKEK